MARKAAKKKSGGHHQTPQTKHTKEHHSKVVFHMSGTID